MSATGRRVRFWFTFLMVIGMIGGAAAGVYRMTRAEASVDFPVAQARQTDFLVIVRCRGELRAAHSVTVYTPNVPGLRIAWMSPSGENVSEGDPIVRFDSSQSQQQLAQKQAQLGQGQAALDQWVAQSKITAEQDKSDLSDAKFNVERARLQVSLASIKSKIEGEEAAIDLGLAEQKLKVTEAGIELHSAADKSKMASLTRVRDQAKYDVDLTKARIAQMEVKSPMSGFLIFNMNYANAMTQADVKPYKVGDNVYSGMQLAEVPDLNTLMLEGKIEEADRGRITPGQEVIVRIDSLPELNLPAKISQISPLAEVNFNEWPATRNFQASAAILHPDKRLRPGMNGGMDIVINRLPKAISIPAKALFTHNGKPVVYLGEKASFRPVEVKVEARNPDEIAVSGIAPGSTIAMVDVARKDKKK